MARGAASQAINQMGLERNQAANTSGTAAQALGSFLPYEKSQLENPTGYTPEELADQLTASSQSLGRSMSSAVGQGNLMAARTRNGAGYAPALDSASRGAMQQQSQNALQVQNQNAQLKQQKQQQAANSLQNLYNTDISATLNALGLGNNSINAWTNADNATTSAWMGPINAASQMASSYMGNPSH